MPNVLILRAPGTNCDRETAHALELAGGRPEYVHIHRLLEDPGLADRFDILCVPGGFSYGDDIAAGRILANQIRHHLAEALARFRDAGKLILGICNGFQVLIRTGLLAPPGEDGEPTATLTWNDSGRFEDRWVNLAVMGDSCVFLQGVESLYLPIAHAEGKFVVRDEQTLASLEAAGQLVLRYAPPTDEAETATGSPTHEPLPFPHNPNGSQANVAGMCDPTGRVFGLIPHPERFVDPTQHPRWTRERPDRGAGLAIFENAVRFAGDS